MASEPVRTFTVGDLEKQLAGMPKDAIVIMETHDVYIPWDGELDIAEWDANSLLLRDELTPADADLPRCVVFYPAL